MGLVRSALERAAARVIARISSVHGCGTDGTACIARGRRHGGYHYRHHRSHFALFLFPAAQAPLRRLGQRGQADGDSGSRRPRPLPQLGLGGARVAPAFPSDRARPARPWRLRLGGWRQLRDGRSCARPPSTHAGGRCGSGHPDRPFAGRGRRVAGGRRIPGFGQGAGGDRGPGAAAPRCCAKRRPTSGWRTG